jgi:uncharacterized protein YegP (UPF0339 family)
MAAKYELKKSSDGQFYFTLQAANNEKILTSEMYKAKQGAENGIASVKVHSMQEGQFEPRTSKAGKPYFVLKALNGEVIGTSEEYSSKEAMETGMAAVKTAGPMAMTDDRS